VRETCERLGCTRDDFDAALLELCRQNVGKLELSGAPMDTAAKDSALGIKRIALSEEDGLVSTSQSTQQVMAGVEQFRSKISSTDFLEEFDVFAPGRHWRTRESPTSTLPSVPAPWSRRRRRHPSW